MDTPTPTTTAKPSTPKIPSAYDVAARLWEIATANAPNAPSDTEEEIAVLVVQIKALEVLASFVGHLAPEEE